MGSSEEFQLQQTDSSYFWVAEKSIWEWLGAFYWERRHMVVTKFLERRKGKINCGIFNSNVGKWAWWGRYLPEMPEALGSVLSIAQSPEPHKQVWLTDPCKPRAHPWPHNQFLTSVGNMGHVSNNNNNEQNKEGGEGSKRRDTGARVIVVLFPIMKQTLREVVTQRHTKEKVHFRNAIPALWEQGVDNGNDGADSPPPLQGWHN